MIQRSEKTTQLTSAGHEDGYLRLEQVTKTYQEGGLAHTILSGTSLTVANGESLAILGKSGTGKTTLLNLISGIDRVDAGKIYLDGVCLTDLDENRRTIFRRRNIGFIFQFFNLIPTLTVWENVTLPLNLTGKTQPVDLQRVEGLLDQVGLADRKKAFPDRLSGGEQQRVALVRALAHEPGLILADEPTGNLDEETGRLVLDLLAGLTRGLQKTLVMVTHSREAASFADRIVHLHNGAFEDDQPERIG